MAREIPKRARTLAVVLLLGACAAGAALGAPPAPPGWKLAPYDSLVAALGRRPDAPRTQARLGGGARSLEEIGQAFCRAIHHDQPESLYALCVSREEFGRILWREFPESRPITGLTADDAYTMLLPRNTSGIHTMIGENHGRWLEFVRFERRDTVAVYRNFKLHNGLVMVVRNEHGAEERLSHLRSVVERKGRFKVYSMKD